MQTIEGFDFFSLTFDGDGVLQSTAAFDGMVERARTAPATDAIFIAHGFRNDAAEASNLYTRFLKTFRGHLSRQELHELAARRFVVGGVYWPSKSFRETFGDDDDERSDRGLHDPRLAMEGVKRQLEELRNQDASASQRPKLDKAIAMLPTLDGNAAAQDKFVKLVLSLLDDAEVDPTEGLEQIRSQTGSDLLAQLGAPAGAEGEGVRSRDIFSSIAGAVGKFLNLTTWYVMKERSGTVGATGVAKAVRALNAGCPTTRIHLVGHSLGGRLMAGCAKALSAPPRLQPDSLTLLEAAFSHYGFSADNGRGNPGFFREVIARQVVKGPLVSTFSFEDTVVGRAYSIMSRLAGDSTRGIGEADDPFGGIGRNGPQKTAEAVVAPLRAAGGTAYTFKPGVITSLNGSGGLIKDHSDVTNDAVTYAFASAVART
jgi:hypothetical protein